MSCILTPNTSKDPALRHRAIQLIADRCLYVTVSSCFFGYHLPPKPLAYLLSPALLRACFFPGTLRGTF